MVLRPPISTLFPYTTLFRSDPPDLFLDRRLGAWRALVQPRTFAHALVMLAACITRDRKSTRLNSSHVAISYAVFCLKKKNILSSPSLLRLYISPLRFSIGRT